MIRLLVGDQDFTNAADGLEWTNVDPGGCETCQFTLPAIYTVPTPGTRVRVFEGLQPIWDGRVEEPGDDLDEAKTPGSVAAVGAGAALKDGRMSMVFIDRALDGWRGPSRGRQVGLSSAWSPGGPETLPDATSGAPGLDLSLTDTWPASPLKIIEAWYDAGAGNVLAELRGSWATSASIVNPADANWRIVAALDPADDSNTGDGATTNLAGAGSGTVARTATTNTRRFALLQFFYNAAGGTAGVKLTVFWTNVRAIGNHGLTVRGATPATEGFYPQDIVRYALSLVSGIAEGVIDDATDLIVPHAVYRDPVPHENVIKDMGTLRGYHWGVWPARSIFDDTPILDFRPPPAAATAIVDRRDCRELRLAQRLSDFHDTALVKYTDSAGTVGYATVTLTNPRLPAGVSRTVDADAGVADAAIAAAIGLDVLELEQQQTRAAGPATLPDVVSTPGGGMKPSTLLQAGIDRLQITGLPNAGAWTETDTARFDTFRIQRLTCRRDKGGAVTTTAELDSGANLVETLQARLALAVGLAG